MVFVFQLMVHCVLRSQCDCATSTCEHLWYGIHRQLWLISLSVNVKYAGYFAE